MPITCEHPLLNGNLWYYLYTGIFILPPNVRNVDVQRTQSRSPFPTLNNHGKSRLPFPTLSLQRHSPQTLIILTATPSYSPRYCMCSAILLHYHHIRRVVSVRPPPLRSSCSLCMAFCDKPRSGTLLRIRSHVYW